jgi:hypothetical protein
MYQLPSDLPPANLKYFCPKGDKKIAGLICDEIRIQPEAFHGAPLVISRDYPLLFQGGMLLFSNRLNSVS